MLTKVHIKDHRGIPLCNVRTTRSIGIIMEPFSEWRELRQTAQCGKCFAKAKKAGWFKTEEKRPAIKCEKCQDKGFYFEARPLIAGHQLCTCPAAVSLVCTKCGHSAYDHGDDTRRPGFSKCHKTGCDCDCLTLSNKPRVDEPVVDEPVEVKETESVDEAAANLIEAGERALKYLKYGRAIHAKEREECVEQLASAIEDMQLWMEGIAEANQTPAQMGWVGRNGQP